MNFVPKINRRSFFIGTAAVGGGMALGLDFAVGPNVVRAADGSPEVGVWVVIRPDNTTVIRIARSEMGQGTLTASPSLSPKNWSATGRRSPPNIRHPARASRGSAPGARSRPAAAAASASRRNTCARAALPPA